MDFLDALHGVIEGSMKAYGLSDLTFGTVTSVRPLAIKISEAMPPLPAAVLHLTQAVIEKKIPILAHRHTTAGLRHSHQVEGLDHEHTLSGLSHSHSSSEGDVGSALGGSYPTGQALTGGYPTGYGLIPDVYPSDLQLENIACYEQDEPLPVKDGYIILNRGLEPGDRVLMLRVMRGQQFVVLSRVMEGGEQHGRAARNAD